MRRILACGLLAVTAVGVGCASTGRGSGAAAALPEGSLAFRLLRTDGRPFGLGALRGRVVLLTVLATWSDPALVELRHFEELQQAHGEALAVVVVALDESVDMVRIFESTFSPALTVTTAEDPARFTGPDGPLGPITVMPTSVLLDREGRIVARMDGMWPPGLLAKSVSALVEADRDGS